ncbi:MAG: DUF58 domain-containing protein [Marinagarivorans sp.]|nr:DUF58 domain-containing protein [Marinagarivorans sp.]
MSWRIITQHILHGQWLSRLGIGPAYASAEPQREPNVWQKRFFKWIDKRSPLATEVTLTRHNLYTFPTTMGFMFLGLALLLWMLGTNYQNNLILALSYLLISLLVVAILHTYANLAGLNLKVLGAKPVFVGEQVYFSLVIKGGRGKGYNNLNIRWWQGNNTSFDVAAVDDPNGQIIEIGMLTEARGYCVPGKLLVESTFPLGLIRCWTWLNIDARALVFPNPVKAAMPPPALADEHCEHGIALVGGDDFHGLKEYRAGDPIKHIAWKHFARDQGLYSKEYASSAAADTWLEWQSFFHLEPEQRLNALCYWALEFERLGVPYGLRLPGKQIPPALGDSHSLSVLSSLARFDVGLGQ